MVLVINKLVQKRSACHFRWNWKDGKSNDVDFGVARPYCCRCSCDLLPASDQVKVCTKIRIHV